MQHIDQALAIKVKDGGKKDQNEEKELFDRNKPKERDHNEYLSYVSEY